ncbi:MAG: nuclear transport factor 2 family protein [Solirubrobacterales bacterium]|jgi:hypothetical protein|nr:nuclear transport factor 2 family protein [Solirubrobacterales bacterium]
MLRKAAICALLGAALVAGGCGSSEDSTSEADEKEIRELVADVNQATAEKDASAFCLLIQPSAIEETFYDIDRCVSETRAILKQVGEQPKLTVESIEVDGDVATVQFSGSAGGAANFVREQGRWYVPLLNGAEAGEPAGSELPAPTGDGQ